MGDDLFAMEEGIRDSYSRREAEPIKMFTGRYYIACAAGGMVSAGATHFLITPMDMLKVNMQVDPKKYKSILSGLDTLWQEQGMTGLWKGWGGKLYGYSAQGACKFGFYEYFKEYYCDMVGPDNIRQYRTPVYMASSASAQIIADVALCPFEAVKVRVQAQPTFAKGLFDGFPRMYSSGGFLGLYKGLLPLWGRNLPFSMIMFSSFEHLVDLMYKHAIQRQKSDCPKGVQLGVTCVAGYLSGSIATIVSNPADNIVTSLYNNKAHNFVQAIRNIGLFGLLTRSLPLRIMLVGPVITMQWFIYDTIKVMIGLPTSGGIDHHVSSAMKRAAGVSV